MGDKILVEVCVDNIISAKNAVAGGASRLELCDLLKDGGLTPYDDFVIEVKKLFPNIPAYAMIRCNPSTDFCYLDSEIETMKSQIEVLKKLHVQGFVFGALDANGNIHIEQCKQIIEAAKPLPVTFHRAFDVSAGNPLENMEKIISIGFERILTSGRKDSAGSDEACALLKQLISHAQDRIKIMPGAGINLQNVKKIINLKPKEIHGSFQCSKYVPVDDEYCTSKDIVSDIVALCKA